MRYHKRVTRPSVVIGLLGTSLDTGHGAARWERWRPTVGLCQQEDFVVTRLELLHPTRATRLRDVIVADIAKVSPETTVRSHTLDLEDPWDFEGVYAALLDFAQAYPFEPEREDYFVHITTGTHVAQICLFLLAETRRIPAKLLQTGPKGRTPDPAGDLRVIDLDLSKYNTIATRFARQHRDAVTGLKSGIKTRNPAFNRLIDELEHVAAHSSDPILIMGPTGAGKSQLARRIYEQKQARRQIQGAFVDVNCATLRGDHAMSTLFGHRKGAYTGAASDRPGLLRAADAGVLFLDEIGELGPDEQAMLLRALEEKRFLPLGADQEVTSRFMLIAGTNRDLARSVSRGEFREDLLARINLWTFVLPSLRERPEDIEPNIDYELRQFASRAGREVRFNAEALARYMRFASSPDAVWPGNFRDLSASITRMATLSLSGRIAEETVERELQRLAAAWSQNAHPQALAQVGDPQSQLERLMSPEQVEFLDRFDRVQLADVVRVCSASRSPSDAGRELFAASRTKRRTVNDADRLRKYLARFGLSWQDVAGQ
jgi:transcriptional regulatory protein RtcR